MPAYNFQKQFAPLVESGQKRQTIRAIGKRRHARPGESLQLYTGQRTKACRKLISPDPECVSVQAVYMFKIIERRRDSHAYCIWTANWSFGMKFRQLQARTVLKIVRNFSTFLKMPMACRFADSLSSGESWNIPRSLARTAPACCT